MKSSYSALMQSKFFNPVFNSAIFDGPVRIYFAQAQESLALKIYFGLQNMNSDALVRAKEKHRDFGRNVLVMLYPSSDCYALTLDGASSFLFQESLDEHQVIAVKGPFEDVQLPQVIEAVAGVLSSWDDQANEHESEASATI